MISWNPWHGCKKYSEGCLNCYVYRMDKMYGRDPSTCNITTMLDLPVRRNHKGEYKYPSGTKFFTCYTSDFFLEDADPIRPRVWEIIRERSDCYFMIITKRIDMMPYRLPPDWGMGYPNVEIMCTMENQRQCDYRFPIFKQIPIAHRSLCLEPLLGHIMFEPYLWGAGIERIVAGGESGYGESIRPCNEEWVRRLHFQARQNGIPFCFKQTGTKFIHLDSRMEIVARNAQFLRANQLGYQDFSIESL